MSDAAPTSNMPSEQAGPTTAPTSTRRAVLNTMKGSAGNLVEWYDVYVYTVFASYFEAQFFDKDDTNSTVYIYAIFAVTFIMRPVGSWFFGRFADRRGRKAALMFSITVMSTCSFVVAVMPTREIIGWWAAVVLVIARLVQGFATGGEYGTSATYMSEAATANRRGFLSSFQYVTLVGGHVLAQFTLLIALQFLDTDALSAWGWRIGFFIGGIAALVVLWIRRSMDESLSESHLEAIREGKDQDAGSLKTLFTVHWRPLLLVFLITAGGTVAFYTYSVNAPAIVKATFGNDQALTATWVNLLGIDLPDAAAARRRPAQRPGRSQAAAAVLRRRRRHLHLRPADIPAADHFAARGFRAAGRRLRHHHRLHVGQRDREGGALSRRDPGSGSRVWATRSPTPCSAAPRRCSTRRPSPTTSPCSSSTSRW